MADLAAIRPARNATSRTGVVVVGLLVVAAVGLRLADPGRVAWMQTFLILFGSLLIVALPFVALGAVASALIEVFVPIGTLEKLARLQIGRAHV